MINIQPELRPLHIFMAERIQPCRTKTKRSCDKRGPHRERNKEGINVCLNEDGAPGLFFSPPK